jgi:hypothetical protein
MSETLSKSELLAEIRQEWAALERLLASLSEVETITPSAEGEWSVKDTIAHLSAWEKVLLDRLGSALSRQPGQYPPVRNDEDVDRFNAQVFAENQDRSLSAVRLEFRNLYTGVLTVLEGLDDAFLSHPMVLDFPEEGPRLWEIVRANTSDHYREHRLAIEQSRPAN